MEDGSDPCPPPHTINSNTPSRTKRENPFVLQAGSKHTSQEGKWTSDGQDSTDGRNLEMLSPTANARACVLAYVMLAVQQKQQYQDRNSLKPNPKTAPGRVPGTPNALPEKVTWDFSQVWFRWRTQVWKRFSNCPPWFVRLEHTWIPATPTLGTPVCTRLVSRSRFPC